MKIKPLMSAFILSLPFLSHTAFGADVVNGFYGGLFATGSKIPGFDIPTYHPEFDVFTGNLAAPFGRIFYEPGQINTAFGGGGGGNIGYRYNCFRFEGELFYNVNSINSTFFPATAFHPEIEFNNNSSIDGPEARTFLNGQVNEFMGFANFFYDFLPSPDSDTHLYPYLGVGVGYQKIHMTTKYKAQAWTNTFTDQLVLFGPNTPCAPGTANCTVITDTLIINGPPADPANPCPDGSACLVAPGLGSSGTNRNASSMVGQGIVGIAYELDSYFNIFLDGRYITSRVIPEFDNRRFQLYTVNLGMNFSFADLG
jgi:hypothetical protein